MEKRIRVLSAGKQSSQTRIEITEDKKIISQLKALLSTKQGKSMDEADKQMEKAVREGRPFPRATITLLSTPAGK